jgi:endogenous inhibitor of DNA gyrase (YacG/DUF329 family)
MFYFRPVLRYNTAKRQRGGAFMPAAKPKIEVVCKQCGKTRLIPPSGDGRPFCNRECMGAYYSVHPHVLKNRTHPFASGQGNPRWKEAVSVTCANCGKPLLRNPSEIKRSKNFFCDLVCHGEWRRKTEPNTTCAQCGKPLFRQPNEFERSPYHFCNPTCHGLWDAAHKVGEQSGNWRGGPTVTPCAQCGKPVSRPAAWAKRRAQAFCGAECTSAWWSQRFGGEGNPNWQGGVQIPNYGLNWDRQRRRAMKRDANTCRRCGKTIDELGREVDVHHIRPFKFFVLEHDGDIEAAAHAGNRLENLICYCRSCHMTVEHLGEPQFRLHQASLNE